MNPRQIAEQLLGPIDWQSEIAGFCKCPGEVLHTSRKGDRDCRVTLDGAPTIHCFHSSCSCAIEEANYRLRTQLGTTDWQLLLPDGKILRSGDVLTGSGGILPREAVQTQLTRTPTAEKQALENLK